MGDVFDVWVNETYKCIHAPLSKPGGKVIRVSHLTDRKTEAQEAALLEGEKLDGRRVSRWQPGLPQLPGRLKRFPRSSPGGNSSTQVCFVCCCVGFEKSL